MCSEWSRFQKISLGERSFRPEDVVGDGNCFYRAAVRSGVLLTADHKALRETIFLFSVGCERPAADKIVNLLHQFFPHTENTFDGVVNGLRKPLSRPISIWFLSRLNMTWTLLSTPTLLQELKIGQLSLS